MRGHTHALMGLAAAAAVHQMRPFLPAAGLELVCALGLAAFGGLLPDVDSDESEIRQITGTARHSGCLGQFVSAVAPGHRGLTHSALAVLAVAALAWWARRWVPWGYSEALVIGYASHLVADALTRAGVPLLWPVPARLGLLPRGLRLTTGTLPEYLLAVGVGVWLWLYSGLPRALTYGWWPW